MQSKKQHNFLKLLRIFHLFCIICLYFCNETISQTDSIFFANGVNYFIDGNYAKCTEEFDKIKKVGRLISFGMYYDSIVNFFLSNKEIIKNNESCYKNIKFYNDIFLKSEILTNELQSFLNANGELLTEEKQKKDELTEYNRIKLINEGENYKSYYQNKIDNKDYNKIGDILYYEEFKRQYVTGNVITTKYTKNYDYELDGGQIGRIMFTIDVWYTYGYGDLYYKIYYDLIIDDKYYWHTN